MYCAFHKLQDLMSAAADLDVSDFTNSSNPLKKTSLLSASKHRKNTLLYPLRILWQHTTTATIVFSVKKQQFLQNQSHLPLCNSTESSKCDSNVFLSASSSIPLGTCLAVTIVGGGKYENALIINRLFFTT